VFVAHRNPVSGAWVKDLSFLDADASVVNEVTTMVADLTGDGVPELVLGLRGVGTAQPLGVEVVSFGGGGTAPSVLAHRDLSHGQARLDGSVLVAQAAQYPNGEPSCCPAFWQETRISYDADRGAFVGTPSGRLPAPESGEF
jgi:hypothetical protein